MIKYKTLNSMMLFLFQEKDCYVSLSAPHCHVKGSKGRMVGLSESLQHYSS